MFHIRLRIVAGMPPTKELITRGFRWPDGANDITFGDITDMYPGKGSSKTSYAFFSGECANMVLEPGCVRGPWAAEDLPRRQLDYRCARCSGKLVNSPEKLFFPSSFD